MSEDSIDSGGEINKKWFVIYTRSRFEKKIYQELLKINIESYLPLQKKLKQWSDRKKWVEEPLFRSYIFVKIDNLFYRISIYNITRLSQEFLHDIEEFGFYGIDNNIVLVREVEKEIIFQTVEYLTKRNYFEVLLPINPDEYMLHEY